MTVFIEATTEPFVEERRELAENYRQQFRNEGSVRRPTRGHIMKEDTYAILRVMGSDGNFIPVIDAAGEQILERDGKAYTTFYSNFFVQTIQEQRQEKQQIIDTFGESYVFFFGEQPRFVNVQGMLLNTADFNWRAEFWHNYENYFRGTKLVERGARLYLIYDDVIVEGYMVSANATDSAQVREIINFNFQMFVTGYTSISTIGDPHVPGYDESMYQDVNSDQGRFSEGGLRENPFESPSSSDAADRENAAEAAVAEQDATGGEGDLGSGRRLTDSLRDGSGSAGDPETSSLQQRIAAATGDADQLVFRPAPRSGETGYYTQALDEFVQLGANLLPGGDLELRPEPEEWSRTDSVADDGVADAVEPDDLGGDFDSTDSEYVDVMGRNGRASEDIRSGGGRTLEGAGIRRDLGGSDLGDYPSSRGRAASPERDVPFGMTSSGGTLVG